MELNQKNLFLPPVSLESHVTLLSKVASTFALLVIQRIIAQFLSLTGGFLMIVTNQIQRAWLG